jgi:opacity protein-like surface antigen
MTLPRSCLAFAFVLLVAPLTHAGTYVKLAGLYNRPGDLAIDNPTNFGASLKRNVGFGAAFGYQFTLFRAEAELQYLRGKADPDESSGTLFGGVGQTSGAVKETAGFVNGYLDLPSFAGLSPYVGFGLGYAQVDVEELGRTRNSVRILQFSGSEAAFGYQGMVGLRYTILGQATIHAGYRIVKREDVAVRDVLSNFEHTLALGDNRMFELGLSINF